MCLLISGQVDVDARLWLAGLRQLAEALVQRVERLSYKPIRAPTIRQWSYYGGVALEKEADSDNCYTQSNSYSGYSVLQAPV